MYVMLLITTLGSLLLLCHVKVVEDYEVMLHTNDTPSVELPERRECSGIMHAACNDGVHRALKHGVGCSSSENHARAVGPKAV
jgi:hypothetical protein